jgi:transcriptional regulator with XRE-family HTH domain
LRGDRRSAALSPGCSDQGISQSQAAKLFGVTQPRVSDLMRGKINLLGLDSPVSMATVAGLHVEMRVVAAAWGQAMTDLGKLWQDRDWRAAGRRRRCP